MKKETYEGTMEQYKKDMKKAKEFNLSEKRKDFLKSLIGMKDTPMDMIIINSIICVIQDQDKEFIKLLKDEDYEFYDKYIRDQDLDKDEIVKVCFDYFDKKIDKLAGDLK